MISTVLLIVCRSEMALLGISCIVSLSKLTMISDYTK